ncbi:hypothetical protein QQX09_06595 [Demequina sp. SYSU T00192]|uniref:Uncharacterized protein n=1 Tax=Demequina litoralis TaxID=3051660 RepID=A0ABT8G9Z0_9MICO|nr:hypothetical protein [Demequina sp. SYSU T00192]MDN4475519.1 hypothetical protein [Demequina sp. SYSU T00192]
MPRTRIALLAALTLTAVAGIVPAAAADTLAALHGSTPSTSSGVGPITAESDAAFALDTPEVEVTAAPEPEPEHTFDVRLTGHQEALDLCAGWVFEDFMAGDVVSSHNHCGGAVVLGLEVGDTVRLTGYAAGEYEVTQLLTVPKHSPASVLAGGLWMQTCLWDDQHMRLARLTAA